MKRILFYCPEPIFSSKSRSGGILRFVELYYAFEKTDDITLCCQESQESFIIHGVKSGVSTRGFRRKRFLPAEFYNYMSNARLLRMLKTQNYDEVIVFDVPQSIHLVASGFKNFTLFLRQDLIEYRRIRYQVKENLNLLNRIKLRFLSFIELLCIKKAKRIIVQCKYDLDGLCRRHKKYEQRIVEKTIIQINNVNPSWIIEKSKCNTLDLRINHSFNICFIGNFNDSRKGHWEVLGAIKLLQEYSHKLSFQIIGDGKHLSEFKSGCSFDNVFYWGRLDNPISILKSCDLLIVPSRADSCPNTVLEALYNQVDVLGARKGGIPEILTNENLLFELNSNELASIIIKYITDENFRAVLRTEESIIRQKLTFDWGNRVRELLDVKNG